MSLAAQSKIINRGQQKIWIEKCDNYVSYKESTLKVNCSRHLTTVACVLALMVS